MSSICLFLCHILNQNVLISLPKTHERTLFKRLFSKNSYGGACPQTPLVLLGHRENNRFYVGAFPPQKWEPRFVWPFEMVLGFLVALWAGLVSHPWPIWSSIRDFSLKKNPHNYIINVLSNQTQTNFRSVTGADSNNVRLPCALKKGP